MIPELTQWQQKHNISAEAMGDLAVITGRVPASLYTSSPGATSEEATQSRLRITAPTIGAHLWRNNNGVMQDGDRFIRFGLANDSKKLNDEFKSSDLIGITQMQILAHHIGRTVGIFTAIEVKHPKWITPENDRDEAQSNYIQHVNANGGLGFFCTHPEQLMTMIKEFRA